MSARQAGHPGEDLSAYLDGELDAAAARHVEEHLAGCAECASLLSELRRLDETAAREAVPPVPEDLAARISRRIAPAPVVEMRPASRRRFRFTMPVAAAASLAAVALISILWYTAPESMRRQELGESRDAPGVVSKKGALPVREEGGRAEPAPAAPVAAQEQREPAPLAPVASGTAGEDAERGPRQAGDENAPASEPVPEDNKAEEDRDETLPQSAAESVHPRAEEPSRLTANEARAKEEMAPRPTSFMSKQSAEELKRATSKLESEPAPAAPAAQAAPRTSLRLEPGQVARLDAAAADALVLSDGGVTLSLDESGSLTLAAPGYRCSVAVHRAGPGVQYRMDGGETSAGAAPAPGEVAALFADARAMPESPMADRFLPEAPAAASGPAPEAKAGKPASGAGKEAMPLLVLVPATAPVVEGAEAERSAGAGRVIASPALAERLRALADAHRAEMTAACGEPPALPEPSGGR